MKIAPGKKLILLLTVLCLWNFPAQSQKLVVDRDMTAEIEKEECPYGNTDACVTIIADEKLQLTFESTMDASIDFVSKKKESTSYHYLLRFPTGYIYDNRTLEIMSPSAQSETIENFNFKPKEWRVYRVRVETCYSSTYAEAERLFRQGSYSESKKKYQEAEKCSDAPSDDNTATKIVDIDSILILTRKANESFRTKDYNKAIELYSKILDYNKDDRTAIAGHAESISKRKRDCVRNFNEAETYFEQQDKKQAKKLYKSVIAQGCEDYTAKARKRIAQISERATVLTYERMSMIPIGISAGSYKNRQLGRYITFQTNADLFELLRYNLEDAKRSEIDISFGLTVRPEKYYAPIWIFFGTGYTGVGKYATEAEVPEEKQKLNFYHAVSPQAGLVAKIGSLALRYTFQYRFAFKKQHEGYIGVNRHVLGLGICF
jgi:tetratricopeptide (TPR) repeat protein